MPVSAEQRVLRPFTCLLYTSLDVDSFAGNDGLSDLHSLRSQDIALFTVCIIQQCDVGGTVRIVLDVYKRQDIDRDMFLTVVNRERMFNELRENSGTARPCFDDFFLA